MSDTRVVSLNGRIKEFGPSLEHAPDDYVYVGRRMTMGGWRLPQSDWANPFTIKQFGTAEAAAAMFEAWILEPAQAELRARIPELRGSTLLCWRCASGRYCHARWLAHAADFGVPRFFDPWSDFLGVDDVPRTSRRYQTVTPAGQWAGAL